MAIGLRLDGGEGADVLTKKAFFVEYTIHLKGGFFAHGDIGTFWWGGTKEELIELKKQLPEITGSDPQKVRYVEIKAMIECFGEPVQ